MAITPISSSQMRGLRSASQSTSAELLLPAGPAPSSSCLRSSPVIHPALESSTIGKNNSERACCGDVEAEQKQRQQNVLRIQNTWVPVFLRVRPWLTFCRIESVCTLASQASPFPGVFLLKHLPSQASPLSTTSPLNHLPSQPPPLSTTSPLNHLPSQPSPLSTNSPLNYLSSRPSPTSRSPSFLYP